MPLVPTYLCPYMALGPLSECGIPISDQGPKEK